MFKTPISIWLTVVTLCFGHNLRLHWTPSQCCRAGEERHCLLFFARNRCTYCFGSFLSKTTVEAPSIVDSSTLRVNFNIVFETLINRTALFQSLDEDSSEASGSCSSCFCQTCDIVSISLHLAQRWYTFSCAFSHYRQTDSSLCQWFCRLRIAWSTLPSWASSTFQHILKLTQEGKRRVDDF